MHCDITCLPLSEAARYKQPPRQQVEESQLPPYVLSPVSGVWEKVAEQTREEAAARAAGSLLLFATPCDRYVAGR